MNTTPQNMPRTYLHGVPCWVDTEQPDVDAAMAFYGGLFGWTFEERPDTPTGRYAVALLHGESVAALAEGSGESRWNTYVFVDGVDAALQGAVAAGASVSRAPEQVRPGARLAGFTDPRGADLRLWENAQRLGAQVVNVPGAWVVSELVTADPVGAAEWYDRALGWHSTDAGFARLLQVPGYGQHLAQTVRPDIDDAMAAAPEGFSDAVGWTAAAEAGESDWWRVAFSVADRDAAAALTVSLGGQVLQTTESPWTRTALIQDPQGAPLVLSQYLPSA